MRTFFQPSPFSPALVLVLLAPAITMRSIAEERKTGTLELLTTMPIRDFDVVLGKFLAALMLFGSAFATTLIYPIVISFIGPLDWGPVLSGYLGLLLFTATLLAIGLLCSTFTTSQVVAFIIAVIVSLALFFVFWLQFFVPDVAPIVEYVSLSFHLDNMARGVIDTRDVLYYVTMTAGALFLSVRSLAQQHA
jgi:ABC-2 type transport system permease protein